MRTIPIPPTSELLRALRRAEAVLEVRSRAFSKSDATAKEVREDYLELMLLRASLELAYHKDAPERRTRGK